MSLKETIMADMKSAMKSGDQKKLACIRFLQSAVKNKEIEVRPNDLTDDDVMAVVKKQVKQRQDSIEQYEKAGRTDLAEQEKFELSILMNYLPAQLSEDQVRQIVDEVIEETGADSMKQMGAVMSGVMAKTKGAADNKLVSQLVKEKLQ